MKRPSSELFKLYKFGEIESVKADYRQTSVDTADTWVILTNESGKSIEFRWNDIEEYLVFDVFVGRVMTMNTYYKTQCKDWVKFEKENKKELDEYKRLKRKFEGDEQKVEIDNA